MIRTLLIALALAGAALPAHAASAVIVLSPEDEAAYRAAYDATDRGDLAAADDALARLADQTLVGHVLARRYLAAGADPAPDELRSWLAAFRDEASAPAIARLARTRGVEGQAASAGGRPHPLAGTRITGDTAAARNEIEAIAQAFATRDVNIARDRARAALAGPRSGQAAWWLGLIAFQAGAYGDAAAQFDAAAQWPFGDAWHVSGAAYWAGRSALAAGDPARALHAFAQAARYPTTFYGQLAEAQLGRATPLATTAPALAPGDLAAFLGRHPEARRAAALAQLGRLSDVEAELRLLHGRIGPAEDPAALALAIALQAPGAQVRIAEFGDARVGAGHCPVTAFQPEDGFRVDRAVIFAIMRQESRFVPVAVSTSNARGLMQLLPSTAQHVDASRPFRAAPDLLHDPGVNMRLGQAYVEELAPKMSPPGDLAKVFAAYNGGPGWLSRWLATYPEAQRDPLLMLEALPREEPRTYAERVLAYMTLCRKASGQPTREIDALASGRAPVYVPMDRPARYAAR